MPARQPTILATSMGFNRAREPWQPSPIFRYAFDLAGNPARPKLCFLSTGTGDRQTSIDNFYAAFAGMDVDTSHVSLFEKPNVPDVAEHLHSHDLIWVDRGSVVNLLAIWRAHGLDTVLRDCWEGGVVLAGESAGSLCWFSAGTTDSFGSVSVFSGGLALLPFANAVHYDDRRDSFQEAVRQGELSDGYSTDAGAGLHFSGTELVAAVCDRPNASAYRVTKHADGSVAEERLETRRLRHSA